MLPSSWSSSVILLLVRWVDDAGDDTSDVCDGVLSSAAGSDDA